MSGNCLSVRMYGEPIGVLEQNEHGKMEFHYLKPFPENRKSISHSLPLSMNERVFTEDECKPFFDGLLPDSEDARKAIAKQHGISSRNVFKLLQSIGKECAGAISFHEMNEPIIAHEFETINADFKTDKEIEDLINKLPTNPLLNGIGDIRLSLAGVQNKMCIYVDPLNPTGGEIGLPKSGWLSTHILKPEIDGFPDSAYNEYFCLNLAGAIHLKSAKAFFRKIGDTSCVIVERYDRSVSMEGIKRLHQEDFCQALRKLPSQKYQNEGGPSFKDCFDLLGNLSAGTLSNRIRLVDYILFNFLVGNTDAHGKNFSILYGYTALPKLAPLYDVLCCQIYPNHSKKMAMKIDGQDLAEDVYERHWKNFCESVGLSFPEFKKRANEMCNNIPIAMKNIIETPEELRRLGGHERYANLLAPYKPTAQKLQNIIQQNIDTFLKRIDVQ